jgi:transcriptional regulator
MFGFRSDGRKLKSIPPIFKIIPQVMRTRADSQVYYSYDIPISGMDEYISKKAEEGIKISYMNIIYAAMIRLIAQRPQLNRFIMNCQTYARKDIEISLAIKKSLSDDGEETNIKIPFDGTENIFEIKEKLDKAIIENKDVQASNDTDILAKALSLIPNFLLKFIVSLIMFLDNHGLLPKFIIKASPFHTSAYLTNVASLGIDAIFHHLYNFGTTGLFLAMGKKKKGFIYDDETIKEEKCISLAFVCDERICDGYYFASSVKMFNRYLKKPELLEENIKKVEDIL